MADISEQKESTNYLMNWALGLGVTAAVVFISWGVLASMHQGVSSGANQLKQGINQIQQQGAGITNTTL